MEIKETSVQDIRNIQKLWADGEVMKFVGFPSGLVQTDDEMAHWFQWIESNRPTLNHYSIFDDGRYCGEAFYAIDKAGRAALDIKLFGFARGRGIAEKALSYAIKEAFRNGAERVWVDPVPDNTKAIALYRKLGFQEKEFPKDLLEEGEEPISVYMEKSNA